MSAHEYETVWSHMALLAGSRARLAVLLGVDRRTLHRWELGQRPSGSAILLIRSWCRGQRIPSPV